MGKAKSGKQFGGMKRMLNLNDSRINKKDRVKKKQKKKTKVKKNTVSTEVRSVNMNNVKHVPKASSAMFFKYNTQLGPPYHVLVDTNFINFSIKNKIDIVQGMMDCLYAKSIPYITDCVMAELEKLGAKYRVALRIVKDERFQRLPCLHKGTYADDCLVQRVLQHKCYMVATCDKDLKRRIRKIPGVPIMFLKQRKYTIERLPDAFGAPNV